MSNTTKKGYHNIHGVNPQALVEKVIRTRIYESPYWKEHCFALSADTLIDKAVAMQTIGGVYANQRPTEFLCLTLKLLQLQPEKEILIEYLTAEEFKYLRALAAFYIRLTFRPVEVYETLEPLLRDFRKIRYRDESGYSILHFDEFIDQLLREDRVCDVILPRLTKRDVLEETEGLGPRSSVLESALEGEEASGSEDGRRKVRRDESTGKGKGRADGADDDDAEMAVDDEDDAGTSDQRRSRRSRSLSSASSGSQGGRFISRSPSPGMSSSRGGRRRSRSNSSASSAAASDVSWRSRSRSISPDRLERMMAEAVGEGRWKAAAVEEGTRADVDASTVDDDRVAGDV